MHWKCFFFKKLSLREGESFWAIEFKKQEVVVLMCLFYATVTCSVFLFGMSHFTIALIQLYLIWL